MRFPTGKAARIGLLLLVLNEVRGAVCVGLILWGTHGHILTTWKALATR